MIITRATQNKQLDLVFVESSCNYAMIYDKQCVCLRITGHLHLHPIDGLVKHNF